MVTKKKQQPTVGNQPVWHITCNVVKQCHQTSPSHHHFYRWYVHHSQMGGLWHCLSHITCFSFASCFLKYERPIFGTELWADHHMDPVAPGRYLVFDLGCSPDLFTLYLHSKGYIYIWYITWYNYPYGSKHLLRSYLTPVYGTHHQGLVVWRSGPGPSTLPRGCWFPPRTRGTSPASAASGRPVLLWHYDV